MFLGTRDNRQSERPPFAMITVAIPLNVVWEHLFLKLESPVHVLAECTMRASI